MASLIYSVIMSLDGHVSDRNGTFDWAAPDEEGAPVLQRPRTAGRHLSLRPADVRDDGLLGIERDFDPDAIRWMKASAERDLTVGGAELAGQALRAGLVDDCHLLISPVVVGGGTRALPDGLRQGLDLLDERRFTNGMVHLHYRTSAALPA